MPLTWPIKDAMDGAAIECAVPAPASWVSATGTNEKIIRQLLADTVRELAARHEWSQMALSQTITGTGAESYSLASDYARLASGDNAVYENSPNRRPCRSIVRDGDWTELKQLNFAGVQRFYKIGGGSILFYRPLPSGGTVTVSYVSKNWKTDATGATPGSTWAAETDLSFIPGHLLQLGVSYRFRRHKGLQYLDRKVEYETELARAIADDRPSTRIAFDGDRGIPRRPFEIPVPDFIPPI
jgi:hypothetical protein